MSETPPRATLAEALADAEMDYLICGTIYVIRRADGTHQRLDPTRVRYDLTGYVAVSDE